MGSQAFVYEINAFGTDISESNGVNQSSPAWVLTFVRWENRDTLRVKTVSSTAVRDPLVVENDCVQVSTVSNKGTLTPSMTATLLMTDVNYETAVAPGDFVLVNMLNWPSHARRVADNARAKSPINGIDDGFKGIFKVQSVRRVMITDPNTGTRVLGIKITGFAFTEFNNTIYFNPYMLNPGQDAQNPLLFASFLGTDWSNLTNQKGYTNIQDMIAILIQSFIGNGVTKKGRLDKNGLVISPNVHFYMPALVGSLLNIDGVSAAKDIYNFLFGVQSYAGGSVQDLSTGMNLSGTYQKFNRFTYTGHPVSGDSFLKPEYWNQIKSWSILNQYTNAPLNELYTCFRIDQDGDVLPTMVFRQIPFTNEDFVGVGLPVTKFLNLPRWKVAPSLILDFDLGREEAARINYVQYFGRSTISKEGSEISIEIAQGNYVYDVNDVQRSGLNPYVVTTQFDEPSANYQGFKSPQWAKILGDALIGGHLKMNGTITTVGLVPPIATGDNFELDGVAYHIEQVTHSCSISVLDGKKIFRTLLNLSSGISLSSNANGTRYDQMYDTKAQNERQDDWYDNALLPGVSESQDTVYRTQNPDIDDPGDSSINNPFPQPETKSGSQKAKKGSGK